MSRAGVLYAFALGLLIGLRLEPVAARYGDQLHRRRILAAVVPITEGRLHP